MRVAALLALGLVACGPPDRPEGTADPQVPADTATAAETDPPDTTTPTTTTVDPTTTQARIAHVLSLVGDAAAGQQVYTANCRVCHAASGLGRDDPDQPAYGANLTDAAASTGQDARYAGYILEGNGGMTAFASVLTDRQIADVLAYVHQGLF